MRRHTQAQRTGIEVRTIHITFDTPASSTTRQQHPDREEACRDGGGTLQARFIRAAREELAATGIPLDDYEAETKVHRMVRVPDIGEATADVAFTHRRTGVMIRVPELIYSPTTGEVTTPASPDHGGSATIIFP